MKKIIILVIVLIVISLGIFLSMEREEKESDVVKIEWIGPQTGQSAVLGMDNFVAVKIAIDEMNNKGGINGKRIQLIIEDDQYDTAEAVNAYNKLVNQDGVRFILINTYGSVFALSERAKNDNVILINPLDCNKEIANLNDNIFCLATASETVSKVLAEHANEQEYEKAGILYWNSDLFMPLVESFFRENYKGEIVISEAYSAGTKDFKTQLIKMIDRGAEAIAMFGYDEIGIAMKQARELGFDGQFYTAGTITSPPLQEASMGNAEGSIFSFWEASKENYPTKSFTEKFVEKQGRYPILDLATYPPYDAINVLIEAIKNANSLNVDDVKESLLKIRDYSGTTGIISFEEDGSMEIKHNAFQLIDGVPVKIK